jgi:hypothetical protein
VVLHGRPTGMRREMLSDYSREHMGSVTSEDGPHRVRGRTCFTTRGELGSVRVVANKKLMNELNPVGHDLDKLVDYKLYTRSQHVRGQSCDHARSPH